MQRLFRRALLRRRSSLQPGRARGVGRPDHDTPRRSEPRMIAEPPAAHKRSLRATAHRRKSPAAGGAVD